MQGVLGSPYQQEFEIAKGTQDFTCTFIKRCSMTIQLVRNISSMMFMINTMFMIITMLNWVLK